MEIWKSGNLEFWNPESIKDMLSNPTSVSPQMLAGSGLVGKHILASFGTISNNLSMGRKTQTQKSEIGGKEASAEPNREIGFGFVSCSCRACVRACVRSCVSAWVRCPLNAGGSNGKKFDSGVGWGFWFLGATTVGFKDFFRSCWGKLWVFWIFFCIHFYLHGFYGSYWTQIHILLQYVWVLKGFWRCCRYTHGF